MTPEQIIKALKPFADKINRTEKAHREMGFPFDVPDDKSFAQFRGDGAITWGDLRRARDAYNELVKSS